MNAIINRRIGIQTSPWTGVLPEVSNAAIPRLAAHHQAWIDAVTQGLRHKAYMITATCGEETVGVLPLCLVAGPIFGKFLVSLPYVNTGGIWARDDDIATELVSAACDLADDLDVKYLELRHEVPVTHPKINFERTDKVHMRLPLPSNADQLLASFKSKLRSQIRKSMTYGLSIEFGNRERIDDFYHVFASNMRDLGTPVFSKHLFASILEGFEDSAELCVVRVDSKIAAAGLLVHQDSVTEVPSASCLRKFNRMNANMFMYWHMLARAISRGSEQFDFGRSSIGSGTHKFKSQWGAQPSQAVWQYYVRNGDPNDMRADSEGKKRLVKIWQHLPVWLTKLVGPTVVNGIP
jgi:FemAB-related protein (PEP-CTERM system-associated)